MRYFTSDLHFFHDREFIYKPRGFKSVEEMNKAYINEWLSKVTDDDEIYIIGDFCLGSNLDQIKKLVHQLPGTIHLIIGNHDSNNRIELYKKLGIDVVYADEIIYKGRSFWLSHKPTITSNLESNPKTCQICLHGHLHTKNKFYDDLPFMYNVSVDANNNKFITLDEILDAFNKEVAKCISYL